MSYNIVNPEDEWNKDITPENFLNDVEIRNIRILSSIGFLKICEQEKKEGLVFKSTQGIVVVSYTQGVTKKVILFGGEVRLGDLPNEIQIMISEEDLQSVKNTEGISVVAFRELDNGLLSDDERSEVGENPADDYDDIF